VPNGPDVQHTFKDLLRRWLLELRDGWVGAWDINQDLVVCLLVHSLLTQAVIPAWQKMVVVKTNWAILRAGYMRSS